MFFSAATSRKRFQATEGRLPAPFLRDSRSVNIHCRSAFTPSKGARTLGVPSISQRKISHDKRNGGSSARDAVHTWLTGFVPFCSGVKGKRGCLSINTSADGAAEQKGVRKQVEAFNRKLEELLRDRLRADRNQFAEGFDPDATAHTIMAIYTGLMVMAKDAPDAARVRATLDQVLKLLS